MISSRLSHVILNGAADIARGTVRQRSKVRKDSWTVQIYLGVDPVTGKRRYRLEAVKGTKAQAQRRLTELQRQVDTKTYTRPSRLTAGEYLRGCVTIRSQAGFSLLSVRCAIAI